MKFLVFGLVLLSATFLSESFRIAKRDVKDDLINEVNQLKDLAEKAVQKLKSEGKNDAAQTIEEAEKQLDNLVSQIKAIDDSTDLGKLELSTLETVLKKAIEALKKELNDNNGSFYDDTNIDDLKKSIEQLKNEAEEAIKKLKAEGKDTLAKGIEAAEKKLEDLESQLEKLDPQTDVGKKLLAALEGLIKKAEDDLKAELKKINGSFYDDDKTIDDLKKSINELKNEAEEAIKKLKAEGKDVLAKGIEAAEKKLESLESQLETLDPQTDVGKKLLAALEGLIKKAEDDLKAELKKINGSFYDGDVKDQLLLLIEKLKQEAEAEIEKLKKEGKGELAKGLEAIEKKVIDIEAQIKELDPQSDVGKTLLSALEALVKKAEEELEAEIKKLNG